MAALSNRVVQAGLRVVLEASQHLAAVVHPLLRRRARVIGNTRRDCLSIALLEVVVSVTEAYPAIVLHQRVEARGLRCFAPLLARVEHFAPIARATARSASLQVLGLSYCLVLLAS